MAYKKGTFWIQLDSEHDLKVVEHEGWIDSTNTYGLYKLRGGWIVTDLASGTSLYWGKTRDACLKQIEDNAGIIATVKQSEKYAMQVEAFKVRIEAAKNGNQGVNSGV